MFATPFAPDRDEAQRLAEDELAKGMYADGSSLLERFVSWIERTFSRLGYDFNPATGGAGSYAVIVIVVLLIAAIIFFSLRRSRIGSLRLKGAARTELFDDVRSAKQLLAAAKAAEAAGDLTLAAIELYRAIIRELDERGLINVIPGMTALEAARAGAESIGASDHFARCAGIFNEVYYWSGSASPEDLHTLRALHAKVDTARNRTLQQVAVET